MDILEQIAEEFKLRKEQVTHAVALLDDGKTVPFIARYRKEQTGSLDDQTLHALNDRLNYLRKLEERKQEITDAITALEKMTPELADAISAAKTLVEVEDLYRPYKQKRKTKASVPGNTNCSFLVLTCADTFGMLFVEGVMNLSCLSTFNRANLRAISSGIAASLVMAAGTGFIKSAKRCACNAVHKATSATITIRLMIYFRF